MNDNDGPRMIGVGNMAVIEHLTAERDEARAELAALQAQITEMLFEIRYGVIRDTE